MKEKHKDLINNIKFINSKNIIITSSFDKTVKIWDFRKFNEPILNIINESSVTSFETNNDKNLFISTDNLAINLFNMNNGKHVKTYINNKYIYENNNNNNNFERKKINCKIKLNYDILYSNNSILQSDILFYDIKYPNYIGTYFDNNNENDSIVNDFIIDFNKLIIMKKDFKNSSYFIINKF
jgi:WD40 repeat protein